MYNRCAITHYMWVDIYRYTSNITRLYTSLHAGFCRLSMTCVDTVLQTEFAVISLSEDFCFQVANSIARRVHGDTRTVTGGATAQATHRGSACRIGLTSPVTYSTVSADGRLSKGTAIDVQKAQLMHDFGITPNYAVFIDQNLVMTPQALSFLSAQLCVYRDFFRIQILNMFVSLHCSSWSACCRGSRTM